MNGTNPGGPVKQAPIVSLAAAPMASVLSKCLTCAFEIKLDVSFPGAWRWPGKRCQEELCLGEWGFLPIPAHSPAGFWIALPPPKDETWLD